MEMNGMEWNVFKQGKGMEKNGKEWNGMKLGSTWKEEMEWKGIKIIILEYSSLLLFGSFNGGNGKSIPLFGSLSERE